MEYDLFRIIGKDHFSLSRKYDLNLKRKMKDDILKKIQGNMIFSLGPPKKRPFQKRPGHGLSCII